MFAQYIAIDRHGNPAGSEVIYYETCYDISSQ